MHTNLPLQINCKNTQFFQHHKYFLEKSLILSTKEGGKTLETYGNTMFLKSIISEKKIYALVTKRLFFG